MELGDDLNSQIDPQDFTMNNQDFLSSTRMTSKKIFDSVGKTSSAPAETKGDAETEVERDPVVTMEELETIEMVELDGQPAGGAIVPKQWEICEGTFLVVKKTKGGTEPNEFYYTGLNFTRPSKKKGKKPFVFSLNRVHLDQTLRVLQSARDYLANPDKFGKKKAK